MKATRKMAVLLICTIIMCMIVSCNSNKNESKVKIGITQWTGCYAWQALESMNMYKDEGVDVEVVMFPNYSDGLNALASGDIDTYVTSNTSALNAYTNGNDVQIILVEDYSVGADAAVVRSDIKCVEDLRGKTIAAELGSGNYILMQEYLMKHGLSEDDYNYVNMSAGDAGNAFIAGHVDCAMLWDPYVTESVKAGGEILFTSADEEGIISCTVLANKEAIKNKSDSLNKMIDAWFKGVDLINVKDEKFVSEMAKSAGVSYSEFASMLNTVKFLTREENIKAFSEETDSDGYKNLKYCTRVHGEFLVDLGQIKAIPEKFDELFNNSFVN